MALSHPLALPQPGPQPGPQPATQPGTPRPARRMWDLLLVLAAAPHSTDVVTSALRLVQAVVEEGGQARLWACGYATMLTQTTHGDSKPPNTRAPDVDYPSSAAIARLLLDAHEGRFAWIACTACSAERGATQHIPQVQLRSPLRFTATVEAAVSTVFIGGF